MQNVPVLWMNILLGNQFALLQFLKEELIQKLLLLNLLKLDTTSAPAPVAVVAVVVS